MNEANMSDSDGLVIYFSSKRSSRKPNAARNSDLLAFIGASKWAGIILWNLQSRTIPSIQSFTWIPSKKWTRVWIVKLWVLHTEPLLRACKQRKLFPLRWKPFQRKVVFHCKSFHHRNATFSSTFHFHFFFLSNFLVRNHTKENKFSIVFSTEKSKSSSNVLLSNQTEPCIGLGYSTPVATLTCISLTYLVAR